VGSAFVESIVSAAIVALALGATYRVIADGAGRDKAAEARRAALLVAQSELADVGADIPLSAGDASGQSGDLAWRVAITAYNEDEDKNPAGKLWDVAVSVGPLEGGPTLITLRSLRLGAGS
jgi:type II secretory pathway pseudopilin PulG